MLSVRKLRVCRAQQSILPPFMLTNYSNLSEVLLRPEDRRLETRPSHGLWTWLSRAVSAEEAAPPALWKLMPTASGLSALLPWSQDHSSQG